jgi:hypothetical protein
MNIPLRFTSFSNQTLSREILIDSFKTALFVGMILNLINNGATFFNGTDISGSSVLLNFTIPFLVSTYSGCRAAHIARGSTLKKSDAAASDEKKTQAFNAKRSFLCIQLLH